MYLIYAAWGSCSSDRRCAEQRKTADKRRKETGADHIAHACPIFERPAAPHFRKPFHAYPPDGEILSEECFAEGLHLTEELLQGDFRRIENHLITDGGPLALVGHHPFLQSYLLEAAGAGIQPDLASISVVDYDMAWKQGKLIAYFTPALKKLKKED